MFEDPKAEDVVQGKNDTCTIAEFNKMTKEEQRRFVEDAFAKGSKRE
tara:strand:- start:5886 stop:6026 length:141 start_codon:yes stop_codon:yes gene_type:complete